MRLLISVFGILLVVASSFFPYPSEVEAAEILASIGAGYLAGESKYQIGGRVIDATGTQEVHFPISELVFPLDAYMARADVSVANASGWKLALSGQTNLTSDTGKMEDSDWGVFEPVVPSRLDIFSESDTDMDALILDGSLRYTLVSAPYGRDGYDLGGGSSAIFSYFIGAGYRYQKFNFDVSNLNQRYPSSPSTPRDLVPGLVLTYEVQYDIPYLEVGVDVDDDDTYSLSVLFTYAPVINVQDEDHHLLRGKMNRANHDWNGHSLGVSADFRYFITSAWFVGAQADFQWLKSDGTSEAFFDGVFDHSIEHRVESDQASGFLNSGWKF